MTFSAKNDATLQIDAWQAMDQQVVAGFSLRTGGVSKAPFDSLNLGLHVFDQQTAVLENRRRFAELNQIPMHSWVAAEQVHHNQIQKVTINDKGKGADQHDTAIKGADGLYTAEKQIVLIAGFADCVPLYFFSPERPLIGMAHAGWKGTVSNIASAMISSWTKGEGIAVENIFVVIGPSICGNCYQVDQHVINQVDTLTTSVPSYRRDGSGKYLLDLKHLNKQLLLEAGILPDHIEMTNYCTSCQNDLFFSHRKENGKTGRMLAYISLRP